MGTLSIKKKYIGYITWVNHESWELELVFDEEVAIVGVTIDCTAAFLSKVFIYKYFANAADVFNTSLI